MDLRDLRDLLLRAAQLPVTQPPVYHLGNVFGARPSLEVNNLYGYITIPFSLGSSAPVVSVTSPLINQGPLINHGPLINQGARYLLTPIVPSTAALRCVCGGVSCSGLEVGSNATVVNLSGVETGGSTSVPVGSSSNNCASRSCCVYSRSSSHQVVSDGSVPSSSVSQVPAAEVRCSVYGVIHPTTNTSHIPELMDLDLSPPESLPNYTSSVQGVSVPDFVRVTRPSDMASERHQNGSHRQSGGDTHRQSGESRGSARRHPYRETPLVREVNNDNVRGNQNWYSSGSSHRPSRLHYHKVAIVTIAAGTGIKASNPASQGHLIISVVVG